VGQVIEILLRPGSIEVRFARRRRPLDWWRRWLRAWREGREAVKLSELDERILHDIGLGLGAGGSLAGRIHAHRQDEARRHAMARLGLM
jgi:uncharacterized protein YjiS (DUF1127 family)